ncbi:hypothetical protein DFH09DRAFT_1331431 [Mycena vulgaris]|nr:hypothetical protein DFH09DRAFT_1331431 [Mycena vulgaris]
MACPAQGGCCARLPSPTNIPRRHPYPAAPTPIILRLVINISALYLAQLHQSRALGDLPLTRRVFTLFVHHRCQPFNSDPRVSLASSGAHPSTPQPSALPPTFSRVPSFTTSPPYPTNPSGTGPRYPSSAGVSFGGANPNRPPDSGGAVSSSYAPSHATSSQASSYTSRIHTTPAPGPMPLRAAHAGQYEYDGESTDSEGGAWRTSGACSSPSSHPSSADTNPDLRLEGLPTTSPVVYPALARHMLTHQRTQGYVPGTWGSALSPAAPAFVPDDASGVGFAGVGARAALDAARATAAFTSTATYPNSFAPQPDPRERARKEALAATRAAAARTDAERAERNTSPHVGLRTVVLPHANSARN